ncbi:hypothetical protein PVAP13_7NG231100 [Panicum virgatum]|uniref:Uncharacterized protein n=1 Tax=Panicum virgatum TaxID=38727 RepID=A0A8T0PZ87_PANVG|nr:hypothetical protein PVAP13_7NG231100 [Panicum virgatum]
MDQSHHPSLSPLSSRQQRRPRRRSSWRGLDGLRWTRELTVIAGPGRSPSSCSHPSVRGSASLEASRLCLVRVRVRGWCS